MFRGRVEVVLGRSGVQGHPGTESYSGCFGVIEGSFWGCFGVVSGSFWVIPGSCWGSPPVRSIFILGSFLGRCGCSGIFIAAAGYSRVNLVLVASSFAIRVLDMLNGPKTDISGHLPQADKSCESISKSWRADQNDISVVRAPNRVTPASVADAFFRAGVVLGSFQGRYGVVLGLCQCHSGSFWVRSGVFLMSVWDRNGLIQG